LPRRGPGLAHRTLTKHTNRDDERLWAIALEAGPCLCNCDSILAADQKVKVEALMQSGSPRRISSDQLSDRFKKPESRSPPNDGTYLLLVA